MSFVYDECESLYIHGLRVFFSYSILLCTLFFSFNLLQHFMITLNDKRRIKNVKRERSKRRGEKKRRRENERKRLTTPNAVQRKKKM